MRTALDLGADDYLTHHLDTVDVGKSKVQQNDVRVPLVERGQGFTRRRRRFHVEAVPGQVEAQSPDHLRLVVDGEYAWLSAHVSSPTPAASRCVGIWGLSVTGKVKRK